MADFISALPEECKCSVGGSRLELMQPRRHYIARGIISIRPNRPYSYFVHGLEQWPWMAQLIRAIEVYVPDKKYDALVNEAERQWKWAVDPDEMLPEEHIPEPLWSKERLAELCRHNDLEVSRHAGKNACKLFAMLPNVEALSVFSKRCPYTASQVELCKFWKLLLEQHSVVEQFDSFSSEYQDIKLATYYYTAAIWAMKESKLPIKKLLPDLVPLNVFQTSRPGTGEDEDDSVTDAAVIEQNLLGVRLDPS